MKTLLIALFSIGLCFGQSQLPSSGWTVFAHGGSFVNAPIGGVVGIGIAKTINSAEVFADISLANRGTASQFTGGIVRALPIDLKFSLGGHTFEIKPSGIIGYGVDLRQVFNKGGLSTTQQFLQQYGVVFPVWSRGHWKVDLGAKYSHVAGTGDPYPFGLVGYTF